MDTKLYDQAIGKVGGIFKLTVLLQKRIRELVKGAQPLVKVDPKITNPIDIALQEVLADRISFNGGIVELESLEKKFKTTLEKKPEKKVTKKLLKRAKKK